jgi:uncharacterized delta-60 repeat protein
MVLQFFKIFRLDNHLIGRQDGDYAAPTASRASRSRLPRHEPRKRMIRLYHRENLLFLALLLLVPGVSAQTLDLFDPTPDSDVIALAMQSDHKVLVGGNFSSLNGQVRNRIGRLNPDGTLDLSFDPNANSAVLALALQPDGKLIIGGAFSTISGQLHRCVARVNADGAIDSSFSATVNGSSFSSQVTCLALQPDGKIVLGGSFTNLNSQTRFYIGRLNTNGSLDTGFGPHITGSFGSGVTAVALQADGKILVGGIFSAVNGITRSNLARLNTNGLLDTTFVPAANITVDSLALQADGRVLLGGGSSGVFSSTGTNLIRLNADGSLDTSFHPTSNDRVFSIVQQIDGKILVGGGFTRFNGSARTNLVRLNVDGTLDTGFNAQVVGVGFAIGIRVYSLALQDDGAVILGGSFTALRGQTRPHLARLINPDVATQNLAYSVGSLVWQRSGASPEVWRTTFEVLTNEAIWTYLGAGSRSGGGWLLDSLALPDNSTVRARGFLAGGEGNGSGWFVESSIGPAFITSQPLDRTNRAGTVAAFSVLVSGSTPMTYQWRKDGMDLVNAGNVSGAQTATLSLNPVAGADSGGYLAVISNSFGAVTSRLATLTVIDPVIITQPTSLRTNLGEQVAFSVQPLGTTPLSLQWRKDGVSIVGATNASLSLTNVQRGDAAAYDLVVSNNFGMVTSAIALLTINLTTLDPFNPGTVDGLTFSEIYSLAVQPSTSAGQTSNSVLVGGEFDMLGGGYANNIGRLMDNGSLDTNFASSSGYVYCLDVQDAGKIVVGGFFAALNNQPRVRLGRLNEDGTLDTEFSADATGSFNYLYSLAVQTDDKVLVGGGFSSLAGQPHNCIGRLNADGTVDTNFNSFAAGPNALIYSLAVQSDGKILAGGSFTNLNGQSRANLGRFNADGTLDASFNPSVVGGWVQCLAVQPDGKIIVGGFFTNLANQPCANLGRLNVDGSRDSTFNSGTSGGILNPGAVHSLVLQTDGAILVGGSFTSLGGQARKFIGRLKPDGSTDPTFDPESDDIVYALALQADGKLLAAGRFTNLLSQVRRTIGRLINTDPASQSLSFDGSTITWLRGGVSPEVGHAIFDVFTNGGWSRIEAVRIPGGWQANGLSGTSNLTIRARGRAIGGQFNGSSWWVETFIGPPVITTQPLSQTNDAGTIANFTALGAGTPPLTYRWLRNDVVMTDEGRVSGAYTPSLSLSNVSRADTASYAVIVSNASGTVTSQLATLTVIDRPLILTDDSAFGAHSNHFDFNTWAVPGQVIIIEATQDFTQWTPVLTNVVPGSGLSFFTDKDFANLPRRFYRAKLFLGPLPSPFLQYKP